MGGVATTQSDIVQTQGGRLTSGPAIVLYLAVAKLLFLLAVAGRYGIFRDELYYLACAEHLAWGYVDQPPLIVFIAWFARHAFGESLLGLRLLPAIAGASLVWLTGKVAREMGGGRFAQTLTALAVVIVPIYLVMEHLLTMNAFEPLIWMGCVWCIIRVVNSGQARYWLWFGVLAGIGMENKYSVVFLVFGVFAGLLTTPERRFLRSGWLWLGALTGLLIFLPNLVWLIQHHFPFLELMGNVRRSGRDIVLTPLAFIRDQAMLMNPVLFPLWVGGLVWLLFNRNGRSYRILGFAYLVMLVVFVLLKGKNYYLAPAYPMLLAAGAVAFEGLTRERWPWTRSAYIAVVVILGAVFAPVASPILPVEAYIRYQRLTGIVPMKAENEPVGPLPQYLADEFGWEDMTREVARVYNNLSPEERASTSIFANNYGEAGAIDFFGRKYGLPKAISNHQNYWYWGPREYRGDIVIVLGSNGTGDRKNFASVEAAGRVESPYSRPDEHFQIFLCRGLKATLQDVWPTMKKWD
jgi:hypothetical protein